MDAQNERLSWLNKHAPQILAAPSVSPQSREQHVAKLRTINLNWSTVRVFRSCSSSRPFPPSPVFLSLPISFLLISQFHLQVTHELLDKVGEVEANLQGHAEFQDRMNRLTDWIIITHQTIMTRGLNPGQAQVEISYIKRSTTSNPTTGLVPHRGL